MDEVTEDARDKVTESSDSSEEGDYLTILPLIIVLVIIFILMVVVLCYIYKFHQKNSTETALVSNKITPSITQVVRLDSEQGFNESVPRTIVCDAIDTKNGLDTSNNVKKVVDTTSDEINMQEVAQSGDLLPPITGAQKASIVIIDSAAGETTHTQPAPITIFNTPHIRQKERQKN